MHSTVLEGGRGGGGECNLVIIIAILCLRTQLVYNVDDSLVLHILLVAPEQSGIG